VLVPGGEHLLLPRGCRTDVPALSVHGHLEAQPVLQRAGVDGSRREAAEEASEGFGVGYVSGEPPRGAELPDCSAEQISLEQPPGAAGVVRTGRAGATDQELQDDAWTFGTAPPLVHAAWNLQQDSRGTLRKMRLELEQKTEEAESDGEILSVLDASGEQGTSDAFPQ
jgi:hypothetical protein